MSFTPRPAKREHLRLLLGLAGGTGSGKTYTAMTIAAGLAGDEAFGVVDTENGRASHYADDFRFDVVDLADPFTPQRYQAAIEALTGTDHKVIVVDSQSHEWEGVGGLLEQHEKNMGGNQNKNLSAWIQPKSDHRKFVNYLLQVNAHIILCFRAAEKVEAVKNPQTGKLEIVPKQTLTGLDGWVPITEKSLPFELTASFLLTADRPGVPRPIKLQEQHRRLIPLDVPLSREVGIELGRWAEGAAAKPSKHDERIRDLTDELLACADALGNRDQVLAAVAKNRRLHAADIGKHVEWLDTQRGRLTDAVQAREDEQIELTTAGTEE